MKRFLGLLLCCLLLNSVALAQEDGFTTLASMEGFYGTWAACSSNDEYEYLVLHADGTFEAYEAWQVIATETPGDALMRRGAYTFDPATGAFTLEGDELAYTLKTGIASEGMESGDGTVEGTADMPTLLLYAAVPEEDGVFYEPSKLFLPMREGMLLLPTCETLSADELEWSKADKLGAAPLDAPSYRFAADGTGEFLTYTDAEEADVVKLTYTIDQGIITITQDNGTVHHWLAQFAYRLFQDENGEPIDDEALQYIDTDDDEYIAINAVWSDSHILVHDLDTGSIFYLDGGY
ncbi:MAG: hypothetical protein PHI98_12725 [Eubacteriales bacterium]|nr:hypothetical protein [Eubacteriales bacterium]